MAKELEIKIKWENDNYYEMTAKCEHCGDEEFLTIVRVEENTHIAQIWGNVEAICRQYFETHLNAIGTEMKT